MKLGAWLIYVEWTALLALTLWGVIQLVASGLSYFSRI